MQGKENDVKFALKLDLNTLGVSSKFTIDRQRWNVAYKGIKDKLIKNKILLHINDQIKSKIFL